MPVRAGILSYGGWSSLAALFLVLFGWTDCCRAEEKSLDVLLVMDNSTSMAKSDTDFHALAAADLVIAMLRPGDSLSIVSCGADATIVATGTGADREALRAALRRLHREASSADPVAALRLIADHYDAKKGKGHAPLVLWFTGRHFSYDVTEQDYYPTEGTLAAMEAAASAADPYKMKAFRDAQPGIVERIGELVSGEAGVLADLGVPVHMFLAGKSFDAQAADGESVTAFMRESMRMTGGDLIAFQEPGTDLLVRVISALVTVTNAPTLAIDQSTIGPKGENFEVLRGCRHLWVVMAFDRLPQSFGLVSEETAGGAVGEWPFGKPPDDVHQAIPMIEKGMEYREKRWYRLPENPVGFAVWSVRDPAPGNYRFVARFDDGVPFVARIIEDVDLVMDFLDEPAGSIPMGMDLSATLVLKNPEGYTYVFNRGFVDGLRFQVLVRAQDGSIPQWGAVRDITHSREGEAVASFSPDSLGVYWLKGKVTSRSGEFVAYLDPFRFAVAPSIDLDFETTGLEWLSVDGDGWTWIDPPVRIAQGVEIPEGVTFRIRVSKASIRGGEEIVLDPSDSFEIGSGREEVRFRVRYGDPESLRSTGARFDGKMVLEVDASQKAGVTGDGRWEIPVKGRLYPWGIGWFWKEHGVAVAVIAAILIALLLVVERRLRPAFPADAVVWFTDRIGGRERTRSVDVGRRGKPLVPFLRQDVVIGHGGDAGFYREGVLCRIEPTRGGMAIRPVDARIVVEGSEGPSTRTAVFPLEMDVKYRVEGGAEPITFWMTHGAGDPRRAAEGRQTRS